MYRLVIITLIIGFVSFNVICVLIDFIININGKTLPSDTKKNNFLEKNWKVIVFDIVIILGIVLTCLAYRGEWFEKKVPSESANDIIEQQSEEVHVSEKDMLPESEEQVPKN